MKMTPSGFVAICQCGNSVGAMDLAATERSDAGKLLGKWLFDGCTVEPRFGGTWSESIKPCSCGKRKKPKGDKPIPSEFIKCRLHSGANCEACGGSGWRRRCDKTYCHEHGCDGGLYCYVSEQEAIDRGLPSTPKPEDVCQRD